MKKSIYVKKTKWLASSCYFLAILLISSGIISLFSSGFGLTADTNTYWSNYQVQAQENKLRTPENVAWFFYNSNATVATLECDVDMSSHIWNGPTGVTGNKTIDGKGHIIKGLNSTSSSSGLVATSSSGILNFSNLTIEINVTTSTDGSVGGFVGEKTGGSLTLTNCKTIGSITNSNNQSSRYVGGLVGKTNSITATNCFNSAIISGSVTSNSVGGLVGKTTGRLFGKTITSSKFELCGNNGNITSNASYVGGIIGYATSLDMQTSRCYNSGNIKTSNSSGYAGGLVGYVYSFSKATISYVFNTGRVESSYIGGGVVGYSVSKPTFSDMYNSAKVVVPNTSGGWKTVFTDAIVNNTASFKGYWAYQQIKDQSFNIQNNSGPSYQDSDYLYDLKATLKINDTKIIDVSFIGNGNYTKSGNRLYSINPHESENTGSLKFNLSARYVSNGTTIMSLSSGDFTLSSGGGKSVTNYAGIPLETSSSSYWRAGNGYPFRYAIFGYEVYELPNVYLPSYYQSYNELVSADLIGIYMSRTGNSITLVPYLQIGYQINEKRNGSGWYYGGSVDKESKITDICGSYTYTYSSSNTQNISYISQNTIKTSTYDTTYFKQNNSINGGMPFFKEMYWEFS